VAHSSTTLLKRGHDRQVEKKKVRLQASRAQRTMRERERYLADPDVQSQLKKKAEQGGKMTQSKLREPENVSGKKSCKCRRDEAECTGIRLK